MNLRPEIQPVSWRRAIPGFALVLWISCAASAGQQSVSQVQNRLLTAKIAYVAHMPDNIDQWLIEDLRAWGKYQVTEDPEGAGLVIRARKPKHKPQYVLRQGQVRQKPLKTPPVLSITVTDWVTGAKLWQADIVNRARKKNSSPSLGPNTVIYAKHMTPDQIAQQCATLLRRYVQELQQKRQ